MISTYVGKVKLLSSGLNAKSFLLTRELNIKHLFGPVPLRLLVVSNGNMNDQTCVLFPFFSLSSFFCKKKKKKKWLLHDQQLLARCSHS